MKTPRSGALGNSLLSRIGSAAILLIHAMLFLSTATLDGRPSDRFSVLSITFNIAACVVNPLATFFLTVGLILQLMVSRSSHADGLSGIALITHCVVFSILALSWPCRLVLPKSLWKAQSAGPLVITKWYPLVGSVCINNGIIAMGAGLALWIKIGKHAGKRSPDSGESEALLNSRSR